MPNRMSLHFALEAIGQLPDDEIDIAQAALQLGQIDLPDADTGHAQAHLSAIAQEAVATARAMTSQTAPARAGALARLLGGMGYAGDALTYDDPANANLLRVIERRRGLPVALGILWLHAGRAAGWPVHGLDFPGHFLLSVGGEQTPRAPRSISPGRVTVDVFAGGAPIDNAAMLALLRRTLGPQAELHPGMLTPMPVRAVLLRLQRNLQGRRLERGDVTGALACVEDMIRIDPDNVALWQDAALLNTRLGRAPRALECHERVLALVPEGKVARLTQQAVDELRARL